MEKGIGECGLRVEDTVELYLKVGDARWGAASLKIEVGDNTQGICRPANSPEDLTVLGG